MIADTVRNVLKNACIEVNGNNPWDIQVHDERWYKRVWSEKSLGLGESYMDGWWDCERIDEMIYRLLSSGLERKVSGNVRYLIRFLPAVLLNLQSKMRCRVIADKHYDLGNDLFFSFLDPHLQYSCGFFKNTRDLGKAQQEKMDLIARKLHLESHDHVLDIGSGWGGLDRYFAEHYGCRVTGVNISREQLSYAEEFCRDLPVDFIDQDYREITGRYDKLVSVGMFEHVGFKNYQTFMQVAYDCMKKDGIFLLHTIGSNRSRRGCDPWISKYIFPNGMLPSMAQIARAAEGLFVLEDVHNLGPHYDKTLMAWNRNFQEAWPGLSAENSSYDLRFKRMWEYYLLSCAGAFRSRYIQLWQVVFTRHLPGDKQPFCRY